MVNELRTARDAVPMAALVLVNTADLKDPNTLLAERGRELYWESRRRTDLIRFGMFLKPWALKPTDDPKYLVFPYPQIRLSSESQPEAKSGY